MLCTPEAELVGVVAQLGGNCVGAVVRALQAEMAADKNCLALAHTFGSLCRATNNSRLLRATVFASIGKLDTAMLAALIAPWPQLFAFPSFDPPAPRLQTAHKMFLAGMFIGTASACLAADAPDRSMLTAISETCNWPAASSLADLWTSPFTMYLFSASVLDECMNSAEMAEQWIVIVCTLESVAGQERLRSKLRAQHPFCQRFAAARGMLE